MTCGQKLQGCYFIISAGKIWIIVLVTMFERVINATGSRIRQFSAGISGNIVRLLKVVFFLTGVKILSLALASDGRKGRR
jgi:hypothetical protein